MAELIFLKLGGSLITDKTRPQTLRADVLARLAAEIAQALQERPDLSLLIGHGSGSFGHVTAQRYGTWRGVATPEEWRGYAEVARVAAELNRHVVDALWAAGVPVLRIQPSASAHCHAGELRALDERPVLAALAHGLVPLLHGDVALDDVQGGAIISTEQIFRQLAPQARPRRVLLVGEVGGVFSADPTRDSAAMLIPEITRARWGEVAAVLGGSRGVDVTGGMLSKVQEMLALVEATPGLQRVQVISGLKPDLTRQALCDPESDAGTRIIASG